MRRLALFVVAAALVATAPALASTDDGGEAPGNGPHRHACDGLRNALEASGNVKLKGLFQDACRKEPPPAPPR